MIKKEDKSKQWVQGVLERGDGRDKKEVMAEIKE